MANTTDAVLPLTGLAKTAVQTQAHDWLNATHLLEALNAAQLGAWCWELESGDIHWSSGVHSLFGLDSPQALPTHIEHLGTLPFDDWPKAQRVFEAIINGAPMQKLIHHRVRWPDGSLHWLEIRGSLIPDENAKPRMMGVIREVTQQRQRQQALNNSEQRFATLFQLSPHMVLLVRIEDGLISEANHFFEKLLGWTAAEAIGRTTVELGLWPDPEQRLQFIDAINKHTTPVNMQVQLAGRDGRLHDGILSAQKVELEGEAYLLSTFVDNNSRKEAEQALIDSQERLDLALDSAQLGTWDWHIPSGRLYGSARAAQLHGLAPEPFNESFEAFFEGVPKEGRLRMRDTYRSLREGPAGNYQLTYRVPLPNGTSRYLESRARLYRDEAGAPLRMAGTLLDITDQVEREQRLSASEEKFASVFQTSPDPICVMLADSAQFIEINTSFTQTFGWTVADLQDYADTSSTLRDASAHHLRQLQRIIRAPAQNNTAIWF